MAALIFDKYEIRRRIAVGGMGEVFYAVQRGGVVKGFERPVILKNLLPDLAAQPALIEQFLDEARVAATLNHPNVVSIYEVGLWNGVYFIAMEFIRGCNLAQLIRAALTQKLVMSPAVAASVIHDAAQGLWHAHAATDPAGKPLAIVHRDVSPQNIMVRHDGVTKVVDFGIAHASNRATRTATGAVKGKLAYMAPEQALGKPVTGLADQFSLGLVFWELLTRKRLFSAERDLDLFKMVLEAPIAPPSTLVPGLPEEFDEVVARMTQREAAKRYPDCSQVARALQGLLLKLSPPASEPPAAGYLRALGITGALPVDEVGPTDTNFVISLNQATAALEPASPTRTSASPTGGLAEGKRRRPWVPLAFVLSIAIGAAAVVALKPKAAEPVGVTAPVVVEPAAVKPVEPQPGSSAARLVIGSTPSGAGVTLDGRPWGRTPLSIEVACGAQLELELTLVGYETYREMAKVEGCAKVEVAPVLKAARRVASRGPDKRPKEKGAAAEPEKSSPPVVAPVVHANLTVATLPESAVAVVYVDGVEVGTSPMRLSVTVGAHAVRVESPDGRKAAQTVEVRSEGAKLQLTLQ